MEAQAQQENKESGRLVPISVLAAAFIIAVSVWAAFGSSREREAPAPTRGSAGERGAADLGEGEVLPSEGAELPAVWGNLGARMVSVGVIDAKKFESVYANRGGFDAEGRSLLYGSGNGNLKITSKNSGVLLNLLWALGLGNKNPILEQGPMRDPQYGGADRFASTPAIRSSCLLLSSKQPWSAPPRASTDPVATTRRIFRTAITAWRCWGCSNSWHRRGFPKPRCTGPRSKLTPTGFRTPILPLPSIWNQRGRRGVTQTRKKFSATTIRALRGTVESFPRLLRRNGGAAAAAEFSAYP